MLKKPLIPPFSFPLSFFFFLFLSYSFYVTALKFKDISNVGPLVTKDQRRTVTVTEFGQISAVEISDGIKGPYDLQFINLEPNSLFLPVLLHADMVFYVHTGSGRLHWVDEEDMKQMEVRRGDIYRLHSGSVFYVQSSLETTREKLRIYAIFTNANSENPQKLFTGPYSTLSDLVLGFDKKVLQEAFKVPEEVIDEIRRASKPPAIVHMVSENKSDHPDWKAGIVEALIGGGSYDQLNSKKKKKTKTFNILDRKPDVENCNGWSVAVNYRDFQALKGSNIGVFMVNLTQGSMMGPHWNPRASEIAIVTHGQGIIRVVCSSTVNESECKNMRFRIKEGDVFAVPRFNPMAQISFNNDSLVFIGFSTMSRKNYPQFLAGKSSMLQNLDRAVLAMSFNVPNTTIDQLLASRVDSTILECLSCAEEEEKIMQEETEREREEEEKAREREREEEEAGSRKEEQEAREREREEEEARRREEEEKRQEEEEEEEARRRREEEARREEEEAKRQEQERQEEEEKRQEEAARRRREEEARREEEEAKRQEQERQEEEAASRREEEEETKGREREEEGSEGEGGRVGKKTWKI